jgi:hypothetical protein
LDGIQDRQIQIVLGSRRFIGLARTLLARAANGIGTRRAVADEV